jgi:hypothetical protein
MLLILDQATGKRNRRIAERIIRNVKPNNRKNRMKGKMKTEEKTERLDVLPIESPVFTHSAIAVPDFV